MPDIPPPNALPIGRLEDHIPLGYDVNDDDYLEPYNHFINTPHKGKLRGVAGFPGFKAFSDKREAHAFR